MHERGTRPQLHCVPHGYIVACDFTMSNSPERFLPLVSPTEVAAIAQVGLSAVANWRSRYPDDFPGAVPGEGSLLDLDVAAAWVRRHLLKTSSDDEPAGDPLRFPEPEELWRWRKVAGHARGELGPHGRSFLAAFVLAHGAIRRVVVPDGSAAAQSALSTGDLVSACRDLENRSPALQDVLVASVLDADVDAGRVIGLNDDIDRVLGSGVELTAAFEAALGESSADGATSTSTSSGLRKRALTDTSAGLADFVAGLAAPTVESVVFDPAAGEGRLLLAMARIGGRHVVLRGQELDPAVWRIARARLLVHGVDSDLGRPGDSIVADQWPELRADRVVMDPPVGARTLQAMWLTVALAHLASDGRAVVVVPASEFVEVEAARRQPNHAMTDQLESLLESGQVVAVAVLPGRTRADVVGPLTVWVIDRSRPRESVVVGVVEEPTAHVAFIDALHGGKAAIERSDVDQVPAANVRDWVEATVVRLKPRRPSSSGTDLEAEVRRLRTEVDRLRGVRSVGRELRDLADELWSSDPDLHRRLMDIVRKME